MQRLEADTKNERIDLLRFVADKKIQLEMDMFGAYFATEPTARFTSPTFLTIGEVMEWMLANRKEIEKKLT